MVKPKRTRKDTTSEEDVVTRSLRIPKDIYKKLEKAAKEDHRSINSEIIACVKRCLGEKNLL